MGQKRTLILDEDDLIMVVDKEVVRQVDENRGEMNRTEFVNFLIHSQLKQCNSSQNYVEKEEFHRYVRDIKELLRNFLEFFLSYGFTLQRQPGLGSFEEIAQQLRALDSAGETDE